MYYLLYMPGQLGDLILHCRLCFKKEMLKVVGEKITL